MGTRAFVVVVCLALAAWAQTRPLVFYNVDVFDGYRMLRAQTVTVEGGMIRDVARSSAAPRLPDSIDGTGKTLLPGLIDAHCHVAGEESMEHGRSPKKTALSQTN